MKINTLLFILLLTQLSVLAQDKAVFTAHYPEARKAEHDSHSIAEETDDWAFVLWNMGIAYKKPDVH